MNWLKRLTILRILILMMLLKKANYGTKNGGIKNKKKNLI